MGKQFVLRAEGHADVPARAARGYWSDWRTDVREFYLRIEPAALPTMEPGVAYELVAVDQDGPCEWVVAEGLEVVRKPN